MPRIFILCTITRARFKTSTCLCRLSWWVSLDVFTTTVVGWWCNLKACQVFLLVQSEFALVASKKIARCFLSCTFAWQQVEARFQLACEIHCKLPTVQYAGWLQVKRLRGVLCQDGRSWQWEDACWEGGMQSGKKKLNPWLCEQRIAILGSNYNEFHSLTFFVQRVFS